MKTIRQSVEARTQLLHQLGTSARGKVNHLFYLGLFVKLFVGKELDGTRFLVTCDGLVDY